ncbi:MAG: hypothetical protein LBT89_06585 [Planctomycetaceae bacterium]|jgi:DNA polymerase-3 subunit delta'|nr:hypothetical protein [Planctomycetaceae bacterium]
MNVRNYSLFAVKCNMAWQNILGHDKVVQQFIRSFQRGRLNGSLLFIGPPGIGKRRFAFALAQALLCHTTTDLTPCRTCSSCKLFSGMPNVTDWDFDTKKFIPPHLDLFYAAKPANSSDFSLDLIVGEKEHRGKKGLIFDISRTAFLGHRKVAVIDDADYFNEFAANALLKTLEEPPSDSVLILLGTSTAKQLPTIRSRCQIIRFAPLPADVVAALLLKHQIVLSPEAAQTLAEQSGGSIERALELIDGGIEQLRDSVKKAFSAKHFDAVQFAVQMNNYIDAKGTETEFRRPRLRLLLQIASEFFRNQMKTAVAAELPAKRLGRTLDALEHLASNANIPVIVEAWVMDIARA